MYTPSVMKNSRLRPSRSVSQPKKKAPSTAPARYALADAPTCASVTASAALALSAPDTAPASVTSRPSSTQVMPSAATAIEWKRPHGRRSSRAGTSDSKTVTASPRFAPCACALARRAGVRRARPCSRACAASGAWPESRTTGGLELFQRRQMRLPVEKVMDMHEIEPGHTPELERALELHPSERLAEGPDLGRGEKPGMRHLPEHATDHGFRITVHRRR